MTLKPVGDDRTTSTDLGGSNWLSDARFNKCFCCKQADCLRGKMFSVAGRPFDDTARSHWLIEQAWNSNKMR